MRKTTVYRKTSETDISATFDIDGSGRVKVDTGIGFFDHMLCGFAKHGFFDLELQCMGDLHVDSHHSVEDTGIVIGQAIREALGDKRGIRRFGYFVLPMDDALVLCSLDISGRPYLAFDVELESEMIGELESEMIKEFFYAVSYSAGMNIHIKKLSGTNSHHIAEAVFKAFGKALDMATSIDERVEGVLSTKGSLA